MPFKSKKNKFRGMPAWMVKVREKSDASSSTEEIPAGLPVTGSAESSTSTAHVQSLKKRILTNVEPIQNLDSYDRSEGYRLIDLSCMNDALSAAHQCQGAHLTVVDTGVGNGLCSTLAFMCLKCGEKTNWDTSRRITPQPEHERIGKLPFDVNRCAAYGVSEIGLGREGLATFCGIMGMPLPSNVSAWQTQIKAVNNAANTEFEKITEQAAIRLRSTLKNETSDLDCNFDPMDFSQQIDVAVSFDGTWHHRGFKSSHGVGVVMSVDTGEVLDVEVLSKDCSVCSKNVNADDSWKKSHFESGECEKNCDGPSTSMEIAAAKILWLRSKKKGLRYTTVLSDGDNKTIAALNELKPYKDIDIQKLDCVNHVNKCMGAGLRTLLKTNKEIKGGKGGLTTKQINTLSSLYKKAIMDNSTTSKHANEIGRNLQKMQQRILANLYHSVYNPDPNIQHQLCESNWCPFKKDQVNQTSFYNHEDTRKKRLPQLFLPHLLPLYKRLSDRSLLMRCMGGLTQNQNEAFNATVWRRCPKERAFGASAVKRGVHLAVITWNSGSSCYELILTSLRLDANHFTEKIKQMKDFRRISEAAKYELKKDNRKRKIQEKNEAEMAAKQQHGDDYQSGMF